MVGRPTSSSLAEATLMLWNCFLSTFLQIMQSDMLLRLFVFICTVVIAGGYQNTDKKDDFLMHVANCQLTECQLSACVLQRHGANSLNSNVTTVSVSSSVIAVTAAPTVQTAPMRLAVKA